MHTAIQMNMPLKRLNVEPQIKDIKARIEKIEELEAQATLTPVAPSNDTFVAVNLKARKEQLLRELKKLQEIDEQGAQ